MTERKLKEIISFERGNIELHIEYYGLQHGIGCGIQDKDRNLLAFWNAGKLHKYLERIQKMHGGATWFPGNESRRPTVKAFPGNNQEPSVFDAHVYHAWKENGCKW